MGFQVAPVYHEGVLFSMGTTGRVFAYQASNGKKLWQTPALEHMVEERNKHLARSYVLQASTNYGWLQSLVFAGETLIVPRQDRLLGIDPNDGNKKWELSKVISRWSTPTIWHHKNKDYLLCEVPSYPL